MKSPNNSLSKNHVILLTGNCASGKSTIAKILAEKYSYYFIDGDQVWKLKKTQNPNIKIHWDKIHDDIMNLAMERLNSDNIVISHLILPNRIPEYEKWALTNGINIHIFVLYPNIDEINNRNLTRTCWSKPTPKYIINTVQDIFRESKKSLKKYYYDNSIETPDITSKIIIDLVT